jgi:putative membrane protein
MQEKTLKRFGLTTPQGEIVRIWAFNQGFYNLFLAIGLFYSLYLIHFKNLEMGKILAGYLLLFIIAAGAVLYFSSPKKYMAALIQSLPALLSLACLFFI